MKDLREKTMILGLVGLTILGVACVGVAVVKQKEDQENDKYFGEYQEEAYPIGTQIEREQSTK